MSTTAPADYRVLSTLNADGSRRWLRPRPSPGRWLNRRRALGYSLVRIPRESFTAPRLDLIVRITDDTGAGRGVPYRALGPLARATEAHP